jgi:hypothetical protein
MAGTAMPRRRGWSLLTDTSEKGLETLILESLIQEAGYIQGRNEDYDRDHAGVRAYLRFPGINSALHECGMGKAIDFPEFSHPQATGPEIRGSVQGHPRNYRHGQLPR